jgi:hypothetical protein
MLQDAVIDGVRSIVIRAGDFFARTRRFSASGRQSFPE